MDTQHPGFLQVKNWGKFQHYGDRRVGWIKLHASILDDREIEKLPDQAFRMLVGVWLITGRTGEWMCNDPEHVVRMTIARPRKGWRKHYDMLISQGFLVVTSSKTLAQSKSKSKSKKEDPPTPQATAKGRSKPRSKSARGSKVNGSPGFKRAMAAYPHFEYRTNPAKAWIEWQARDLEPLTENVIAHIEARKAGADWKRNGGSSVMSMQRFVGRTEGIDFAKPPSQAAATSQSSARTDTDRWGIPGPEAHAQAGPSAEGQQEIEDYQTWLRIKVQRLWEALTPYERTAQLGEAEKEIKAMYPRMERPERVEASVKAAQRKLAKRNMRTLSIDSWRKENSHAHRRKG